MPTTNPVSIHPPSYYIPLLNRTPHFYELDQYLVQYNPKGFSYAATSLTNQNVLPRVLLHDCQISAAQQKTDQFDSSLIEQQDPPPVPVLFDRVNYGTSVSEIDSILMVNMIKMQGEIYLYDQQFDKAIESFEQSKCNFTKLTGDPALLAEINQFLGGAYICVHQHKKAISVLQHSRSYFKELPTTDANLTSLTKIDVLLGAAYLYNHQFDKAIELLESSWSYFSTLTGAKAEPVPATTIDELLLKAYVGKRNFDETMATLQSFQPDY